MSESSNISGKVTVITGASSGIGHGTALHLAEQGAKVVLGARREDRLKETTEAITQAGGSATWKVTDVTDKDSVQGLVDHARETYGPVDVLINNAGVGYVGTIDKIHVDIWDLMIDVNIKGPLYGIAAVLPEMMARKQGHILTTTSIAANAVLTNMAVYSGTKFAVKAICEGLRQEAGPHNIRVTQVLPGLVMTEIGADSDPEAQEELMKEFEDLQLLEPIDIARAFAFAINQPNHVNVNEVVVRPTGELM
ncbi:MAG: oxidoreductase [Opitutaceae bacterium]|nr:oxidoreductase [Opitutaceae bacterium]